MAALQQDKVVAFMDMGTNSVRLMIVRISPNHTYTILSRQKEMIRLGAGEFDKGFLLDESMDRGIQVCKNFTAMAHSFNADDIVAVATSATRDAQNQKEFLSRLKKEAGLDIRVISGTEEARLIYLGVSSGTYITEKSLFIDIGGGSTELIVGNEKGYQYLDSLKLGAIRLTMLFLGDQDGPVSSKRYSGLQEYIRNSSIRTFQRLREFRPERSFGSSGTIQNLAEISCQTLYGGDPEKRKVLRLKDLKQVMEHLCSLPLKERQRVPGINPTRADIIIGGAVILDTILSDLKISEIQVSSRELRDGLLADYLYRNDHPLMDELSVRQRSVLKLGRRCSFDERHAQTVARLALELFDSARAIGLHKQGQGKRELLFYAAQLHDVGTFLSYDKHHASSAYLIRHADLLGFGQDELAIMAATAYFHRKAMPSKKHPEFAVLDERSQEIVRPQSIFLRIAESLDRSHAGLVESARFFNKDKDNVFLEIKSSKDCQLELWGVQNHCEAFEKVFDKALVIVHTG
jgi:exopolyphosphatase/guanosine-5'-triphosphate,3'-diphosphate pyrophosphatase